MPQYKIWNNIDVDNGKTYSSNKSFGANEDIETTVYIGTSAKNSEEFVHYSIECLPLENGDLEFRFYVENELIKTKRYSKKN